MANDKGLHSQRSAVMWVWRHWEWLAAPVALLTLFYLFTPPSWFLRDISLTYNAASQEFTLERQATSVANLFAVCRTPESEEDVAWCRGLDNRWPVVFAKTRTTATSIRPQGVIECYQPPNGNSLWLWYQWEPFDLVSYKSHALDDCITKYPTVIQVTRKLYLFGVFPLARRHVLQVTLLKTPLASDAQSSVWRSRDLR